MTREPTVEKVMQAALAARQQAYAPYSKFLVGAALLDDQGTLHTGCNVENASFGLTVCAERVAIQKAISVGRRQFSMMAVATTGGHAPCGACRQVMSEFARELRILLVDIAQEGVFSETTLNDLLPSRFEFDGSD